VTTRSESALCRHGRIPLALLCAALASGAALAGCSTTPSASSSSSGNGSSSSSNASGSPIVIGGLGSIHLAGLTGADAGFKARIALVNSAGGIDGHKIEFTSLLDDGGSAASDLTDAQQLILRDNVFAIFDPGSVSLDQATINYAAAHKVPIFGYAFTPGSCGSKYFWPMIGGGCWVANTKIGGYSTGGAVPDAVSQAINRPRSELRWSYVTVNSEPASAVSVLGNEAIKLAGADPIYASNNIPTTGTVNYTPYVQKLMNANPNVAHVAIVYTEELGFIQALKAAGFKGAIYAESGIPSDLFTADPGAAATLNDTLQGSQFPTPQDNTPASRQEIAALKAANAYTSGDSFGTGAEIGYWSADQLVAMLEAAAKNGPLTSASVAALVNTRFTYHGPQGYIVSQTWPQSEEGPTAACRAVQQVDTAAKSLKLLVPFTCYPLVQVTAIPPLTN
jgi:branched-chain amino acid transport system substrate-binding protein